MPRRVQQTTACLDACRDAEFFFAGGAHLTIATGHLWDKQ
jgi:hypothetical protein